MYMDRQIDKKFIEKNEIVLYKATIFYLKFKRNYSCLWIYDARYEKQKKPNYYVDAKCVNLEKLSAKSIS